MFGDRRSNMRRLPIGLIAMLLIVGSFLPVVASAHGSDRLSQEATPQATRAAGKSQIGRPAAKPTAPAIEEEPTSEATPEAVEEPTPVPAEESVVEVAEAVASLDDVVRAVIQIEAVGTFEDIEEGMQTNAAGAGSGFIIDPEGIAVTNNHVVTGAALLRVFLEGEEEPRNARVLGVSECADLAVIDIQGSGYPYLTWSPAPIKVGLDVYSAGFPLGDPEFTLTRGIIAKARAGGASNWASVDHVVMHEATINPGNSGGPLVDANGAVVGVNYATNRETDQNFAIAGDLAQPLVEILRTGVNQDSLGINGEAFATELDDGSSMSGIWIASVASGSQADQIGLQPGDILLSMEGVTLAEDGSMTTYCDILQSHSPDDVLAVEVLRLDTSEVLEGQINGRPLEQSFSIAEDLADENVVEEQAGDEAVPYTEYTLISDEAGILSAEVPIEWADVRQEDWTTSDDEVIGFSLYAASDVDAFLGNWDVPGVILNYSEVWGGEFTTEEMLDGIDFADSCTYVGREELPGESLSGHYDTWEECGDVGSRAILVALTPPDESYVVELRVFVTSEADLDALDRILDTFVVSGTGEGTSGGGMVDGGERSLFADISTEGLQYEFAATSNEAINALLPADWDDTELSDWEDEEGAELGKSYVAAPDIEDFNGTWTTPGVTVSSATDLSDELELAALLDGTDLSENCSYDSRSDHEHTIYGITYVGAYDLWVDCGGEDNFYIVLMAASDPLDSAVFVDFFGVSEADAEAFAIFEQSFFVGEPATDTRGDESVPPAIDLVSIEDETGTVSVDVPADWSDVESAPWEVDGETIGVSLSAATDLQDFRERWDTPGVFLGVADRNSGELSPDDLLDETDYSADCTGDERYDYATEELTGKYDVWIDCGGETGNTFVVLVATPVDANEPVVFVQVQVPAELGGAIFGDVVGSISIQGTSIQSEDEELADFPLATVVANALNVRSGPSTDFNRVGSVRRDDLLGVLGQTDSCTWLQVVTADGIEGWVSGNPQYVELDTPCDQIAEAEPPASPPAGTGGSTDGGGSAASGKGCYTFQNQLGPEVTITFTNRASGQAVTFKVPQNGEKEQCFDPGEYTYTLDAPPPWGSTNGELAIQAGDNFYFPITPAD